MMGLFLVSLGLVTQVPTEFFPPSDNGWISATVKLEQNLSVDYTARIARQIDSIIYKNYPEVTLVSASSGAMALSPSHRRKAMRSPQPYSAAVSALLSPCSAP